MAVGGSFQLCGLNGCAKRIWAFRSSSDYPVSIDGLIRFDSIRGTGMLEALSTSARLHLLSQRLLRGYLFRLLVVRFI